MIRAARPMIALAIVALAAALLAVFGGNAGASSAYESPYTYEQTFGTALRLVRVDLGLKIVEKDEASGYVMFEYTSPESGKRKSSGSIELVKGKGNTHVAVQLPAMPQYHEQMILDALMRKLLAEHGEPPKHIKPQPDSDSDAGDDAGDGGST